MISVCLTTYNGEKHLKEQLESILSQISEEDEVIVSDDGSTDRTLDIISECNDNRVKLISNKKGKGVIRNVENALENISGDYIFLADQDDVWLPEKVGIMKEKLKSFDLVVSDCFVVDENLKKLHDSFYKINKSKQNKWPALMKNPYLGCCMAFNSAVLKKALPFPKNIPMHDIWIGNVAAFNYKVGFIPDKLILYRRHGENVSTASEESEYSFFEKIKMRLNIIISLITLKKNYS